MIDFIKIRYFFYFISLLLVLFGALSLYIFHPKLGIDLIGGEILEIKTNLEVKKMLKDLGIRGNVFQAKDSYIIKGENLKNLWSEIKKRDPQSERIRQDSLSSNLSYELRRKALLMTILVLLAIGSYVAFAFRKLKTYFSLTIISFIVIVTLFHDIMGSLGFYVFLSKYFNFDLDLKFITAMLIIAGFSVHDTIIVFDRLRENLLNIKSNKKDISMMKEIFNQSITQTLRRSIFTSSTAILAILPLTFLIPELQGFLMAIQIGIIIGTYSSICLASPLLFEYLK